MRKIKASYQSQKLNMGGNIIDQPLPNNAVEQIDPFLLLHHWKKDFKGGQKQKHVGVSPHPHRGFSPVTVIFEGAIHHRDSLGNDSVVAAGGVQWMHAGKGITHSERPSKEIAENGGLLEMIQFWVNSPSRAKMNPAKYTPLEKKEIPVFSLDNNATMQLIAGTYQNVRANVETMSVMHISRINTLGESEFQLNLPGHFNVCIYQLDGSCRINNSMDYKGKSLIQFEKEEGEISIHTSEDTRFLVLAGEPINEEVKSYGPFVMNNSVEVMQAIRDAQIGKMGVLIEEFS